MPQPATKYLHRKCRRCGRWTTFLATDRETSTCVFCKASYGRLEVGFDVQTQKSTPPPDRGHEALSMPAVKLPDLKPGDFGYVAPKEVE